MEDINALYWIAFAVITVLALAINAGIIASILRFKGERGVAPRRIRSAPRLQFLSAGALGALALLLFILGVAFNESAIDVKASGPDGLTNSDGAPTTLEITATGQQWIWRYEYPSGDGNSSTSASPVPSSSAPGTFAQVFSYHDLVVPVDTAVVVSLESTDVTHSWWIPGLTMKAEAAPGDVNQTWFKADEEGTYEGASYQFSGASYAAMRTRVRVVSVDEYTQWLDEQGKGIQAAQDAVQQRASSGGESQ